MAEVAHRDAARLARMSSLELRHLIALQAVAAEQSFTGAGTRLGYAQSAISAQIAALERIVAVRLVDRSSSQRRVRLTSAGEAFLDHANAVTARLSWAGADLEAIESGSASVSVGSYQSVGARLLPRLLARFAAEHPAAEVRLTEAISPPELLAMVEAGTLDLAFAHAPVGSAALASVSLFVDEFCLLVAAGHPLALRSAPLTMADLAALPLVLPHHCEHVDRFETGLRLAGHEPNVVVRSEENGLVHGLVRNGVAAAIVTRLAVDPNDDAIAALDVGDLVGAAPAVVIAWHRDRSLGPTAKAFVALARRMSRGPLHQGGPRSVAAATS